MVVKLFILLFCWLTSFTAVASERSNTAIELIKPNAAFQLALQVGTTSYKSSDFTTAVTTELDKPLCKDCYGHGVDSSKDRRCKFGCRAGTRRPYSSPATAIVYEKTTSLHKNNKENNISNKPTLKKGSLINIQLQIIFGVLSAGIIILVMIGAYIKYRKSKNNRVSFESSSPRTYSA